jgi:hypothetical protein
MTDEDTMDVLTGFAVLLALMLAVAAWIHTFTEGKKSSHETRMVSLRAKPWATLVGLPRPYPFVRVQ